jgi:hypothetical protein
VPANQRRGLGHLGGNEDVVSELTRRREPPKVVDPEFHVAENPVTQNIETPDVIAPQAPTATRGSAVLRKRGRPPEGPKESFHAKLSVDVYEFLEQEWREGRPPDGKRYRHRGEYLEVLLRDVRRQKTGR